MKNRTLLPAMGIVVATSIFVSPTIATAAPSPTTSSASAAIPASSAPGAWTSIDWREIASRAEAAGDFGGAADARAAERLAIGPTSYHPLTAILKKAAIALLRHAADKAPKAIRPFANKIANVLEEINSFQESAIVGALLHVGIPYDVAVEAARWIVIFIGV